MFTWFFWSRGFNRCSSENEFMSWFEFSPLWFWFCSLILVLVGSLFRFWSHLTKKKKKMFLVIFVFILFYQFTVLRAEMNRFWGIINMRGDVCCVTCLIFDRLPDNQAECPVWLPLHYSFWHYVHSSDFCLLFCSRHQSFRNSQSTSCFSCLSQLMSCQNRCLKLKTKNFWMDVLFGGNILTFNPAVRL